MSKVFVICSSNFRGSFYTAHDERALEWHCTGIARPHAPGSHQVASSNDVTTEDINSEAAGWPDGHSDEGNQAIPRADATIALEVMPRFPVTRESLEKYGNWE